MAPPNTDPEIYYRYGDRPWFAEYHWHGIELLTGNAFLCQPHPPGPSGRTRS